MTVYVTVINLKRVGYEFERESGRHGRSWREEINDNTLIFKKSQQKEEMIEMRVIN